ncbi:MAG: MFS transporter [Thermodesulfovibrionales bacterium]|nr:MFS transporter [Thermodesulfovibrionales bacterium]
MNLNKKHIISWTFFDFANSSYSAVIASVVFPVYYANTIVGNETGLGDLWWGRVISVSMASVALSSPFLGGIADYGGIRKRFLFLYTALSVAAIAGLSILDKGMILEGFALATIANIGMEGGLVFYNSFLPRVAPQEYQGRVSAWGFGVGYAGSIISLLFAIPLVRAGQFEVTWLMVATFFGLFSIPAFLFLPGDTKGEFSVVGAGIRGLRFTIGTLKEIWGKKELKKFLISYLIYEDGLNTVIVFSSIFAATTLGFEPQELIALYIIVQVTALLGSFLMAKPIDLRGPKKVVMISLLMWTSVATIAFFVQTKAQFWVLASLAGLGLGTVRAATRALYTQFIPEGKEAEYFGVYSLVGKSSAILGPLIFGLISSSLGSQRPAILSVAIFFLIGMVILKAVKGGGPNIKNGKEIFRTEFSL